MLEIVAHYLTIIFLCIGSFFLVVGSLGLVRMPDVFCRMHSASKASTFGIGFLLLASFSHLGYEVGMKAFMAITFIFITAPIGAHMISKAAYLRGAPAANGKIPTGIPHLDAERNKNLKDPD